jgi:hypothetical protein
MAFTACLTVNVSSVNGCHNFLVKADTSIHPAHLPCCPACLAQPTGLLFCLSGFFVN